MNNQHDIGKRISSFELYDKIGPITGVALLLDDENELIAGDDSGYMLEVSCPYGTQTMANNLLATLKGNYYQGFRAENAVLSPAAELGDDLLVNGVQSVLAHRVVNFGPGHMSEIAAPGESTMEHEFSWKSPYKKEFDRKIAQTHSLIAKTAEEIRMEINGGDKYTKLEQTLEGFTFEDEDGTVYIDGGKILAGTVTADQIDATNLKVQAANIEGKLTAAQVEITLDGAITWEQLAADVQNEINDAYSLAADAEEAAADAADTVDGWRYNGGTYIDGSMIKVGTVVAGSLIGGEVGLLTSAENIAGGLDITGASTSTYAIELWSYGALRLEAYNGAAYMGSGDAFFTAYDGDVTMNSGTAGINVDTHIWMGGNMFPVSPDTYLCGNANFPWSAVWSTNGMCETSDRNKKKDITYGLDKMDGFFDGLMPGAYRMKNGTSGRKHYGFVAQDIKANLDKHSIPTTDFGGYVEDKDEDGNPVYALRYSEFIALLVDQVQKLKARVAQLEGKKAWSLRTSTSKPPLN